MNSDPAICLLESKLGPIYEKIYHSRKELPEKFEVAQMSKQINDLQIELENERRLLCMELRNRAGEAGSKLGKFNQNLAVISFGLDKVHSNSQDLAQFCSQLAVNFTHITDKLDTATTIVSRAVMVQNYLKDISIYDLDEDFEKIKEKLKKANGLSFGEPGDEELLESLIKREAENYYYYNFLINMKSTKGMTTKYVNLHRTAEYVSKLLKIVDIAVKQKVAQTAFQNIKKHQSILIMTLLKQFNDDKNDNVDELKNISSSLFLLGVGEDAINNFIGKSLVFSSEQGIKLMYDDSILQDETSRILSHYDTFCTFITNDCKKLWPRICEIFDRSQTVKMRYIKKVAGILSTFVSGVLHFYVSNRIEEYCTALDTMYERTRQLINDIWKIDNQEFIIVQSFLDELFSNHQKCYGAIEIKVYTAVLRQKLSPTFDKLEKAKRPITIFTKSEDIINPFNVFDEELLPEFISISKASLTRCALLSFPDQTASNLKKLIKIFMNNNFSPLMTSFIKVCSNYISQNQDDDHNIPKFLKIIMLINSNILSLEDVYISTLKEILRPYSDAHSLYLRQKDELIENLEKETVIGLQACIDCAKNHSLKILSTQQKKSDFVIPEDSLPFITEACKQFCHFLKKMLNGISDYINGDNKVSFLTVLGNSLFNSITEHLLNYRFNITGALNLMMDVTEYQSALSLMNVQEIDEKTSELVKVSHIMTVSSNLVESAINDLTLSKGAMSLAKKLLMLRTDAKDINIIEIFQ
ncbi:Exocyst complex component 5 [Tritrichomonas musculus]|uniref:Exocyst complex component 5 n=1 Tax=Tritrichomonas musculus TaxID=1915356 RepID=A0ABR2L5X5_9EUKA